MLPYSVNLTEMSGVICKIHHFELETVILELSNHKNAHSSHLLLNFNAKHFSESSKISVSEI